MTRRSAAPSGHTGAVPVSDALVCAALRQALPVSYHGATVDAESRANIMRGNTAFAEACPDPPAT